MGPVILCPEKARSGGGKREYTAEIRRRDRKRTGSLLQEKGALLLEEQREPEQLDLSGVDFRLVKIAVDG